MYFEGVRLEEVNRYIGGKDAIIVDLRKKEDYDKGHIPNAVSIPYNSPEELAEKVRYFKVIILYCYRGNLSMLAARDLSGIQGKVYHICGGIHAYPYRLER
ncbi:MAG TPA: rhodanese-like domain-containing protein [Lachnoclostridium phytofermentans]|uniref:Rhodanese-like domain-containing protein n=1 Tax=Lachnoclostridium phytofermentans TaxID=66219 RepID=A0A3D2X2K1_9FIRM|nr:rhodanese-like domain-containing protein [Lachnoclostridium sp.]HCL01114.1 rhodanese-like domain-containing protein [Lachnoclostridium phytofermentans]